MSIHAPVGHDRYMGNLVHFSAGRAIQCLTFLAGSIFISIRQGRTYRESPSFGAGAEVLYNLKEVSMKKVYSVVLAMLCALTTLVVAGQEANLDSGLVGWWSFNEGSGSIACDSSSNGNNGTIAGA